jgi:hypothetical protein
MKTWRSGAVLAAVMILLMSWLLAGCPGNDHGDRGGMKDGPRKTRNY